MPPAPNPPPRPRLVRPDDAPPIAPAEAGRSPARPSRLLPLALAVALAAALAAAVGWGVTARRAAGLEARLVELGAALETARAEITARQRHLEAVRGAAAEVEARVAALRALAEQPPAPGAAPAGD
jgi:hypothetical protein